MRILFLLSTLDRTGPVNLTYDIIKYLPKDEFQIFILTLSPELKTTRRLDFEDLKNVAVYSLGLNRWQAIWRAGTLLTEFCENYKPDIIHSQGFRSDILATRFLHNYKKVYHIHNYPYDDYVMLYGIKGYIMAYLHLYHLKNQDNLIACSKYLAQKIKKYVNTPVKFIQNGIDQYYKVCNCFELNSLRTMYSIGNNDKVFLMAGSLIERKNPLQVIKAFEDLNQSNFILIILGDGPLIATCRSLIKDNSRIHIVGHVNNVSTFMQISDYYITASFSEGLPISVLEALNHGLPVLLSDIPQHKEVLEHFPNAGILFDNKNLNDLKLKINMIVNATYNIMQRAAIESIRQHFNAKRMSINFQHIYENCH